MAERRMFAKTIVLSDDFLDMPLSARCLYFTLGMFADDDGFVNSPKGIMRQCGASNDDLNILIAKRYVLSFESGVIVIKHWRINNFLRNDRYQKTKHVEERARIEISENGSYEFGIPSIGIPSIGKDSIGKDSLDTVSKDTVRPSETEEPAKEDIKTIVDAWNSLSKCGIDPVLKLTAGTKRHDNLKALIRQYGIDDILLAISNVRNSQFLQGKNDRGWTITFDWFVKPNNFPKVLEGNYTDKKPKTEGRLDWIDDIDFGAVENFS